MTPEINFVRFRPRLMIRLSPKKQFKEALHQLGVVVSGAALVSAIGGYGALMLGRSVPAALALSALGSAGAAANCKLRER